MDLHASGSVNYFCQKLHLKPLIGLWICQFLTEISKVCYEETQNNSNKHVPFVPRNSCSKIFINFDFGWQIINWAACSLTPIFMNTCIFRSLEIALLYYHFCYCNLWPHTNTSRLTESDFHKLITNWKFIVLYSHVVLLRFSFNMVCSIIAAIFVTGVHFINDFTEWLNFYLNSTTYCCILNSHW